MRGVGLVDAGDAAERANAVSALVLASRRAHTLRGLVIVFYTVMTTRCSTVPAWVPVYVIQPTKSVALYIYC